MRRRFLTVFLVLDVLAAPALVAVIPDTDRYVEVAGVCVEQIETGAEGVAGRPVSSLLCALP